MGKNLDTESIFGSYLNNVLLKEAVKPVESNEPATPLTAEEKAYADSAKAQGKNWTDAQAKLMFAKQNQAKQGSVNTAPKPTNSTPVTPASQASNQKHEDDIKRFLGELPEETGDTETHSAKEIQDWMDANAKEMETQNPELKGNWVNTSGEPISDSEDMGEPTETTTQVIPNAAQISTTAAGDDEFEQNDEEKDEKNEKINEKINISKFLKHLSEKNYSSAHKYLKAILEQKVKTKVLERINKI